MNISQKSSFSTEGRFSLATLVIFAIALIIWCAIDTRPPAWDQTVHLQLAFDYQQWLFHGQSFESRWTAIYPPLYHLSLIPSLLIAGPNADGIVLTNVLYLAVLIWGMVNLSKHFIGSPWTGLIAALVFISMPIVLQTARQPLIDFALAAWVVAGMEWLRRTEGFTQRRAVIIFGIWSGLGLLLKPFYPLWFVGPVLLCVWQGRQASGRWPVKSIGACAAIAMLLALPYYGWQGVMFLRNASQLVSDQGSMEGDPGFTTLAGWWWYVNALKAQAGLPILSVLVVGSVMTVWLNSKAVGVRWLLVWVLSGYLLFVLNHNKDMRYTLPMLPPFTLLGLWQLNKLFNKYYRAGWLMGAALFSWSATSLDLPHAENWQHQKLLEVFKQWREPGQSPLRVALVSNYPYFFSRSLEWSALGVGIPLRATLGINKDADFNEFVVLKSGELNSDKSDARRRELLANPTFTGYYVKVATLPLPDGSDADVYHRNTTSKFQIEDLSKQTIEAHLHDQLAQFIAGAFAVTVSGDTQALQHGELESLSITGGPWMVKGVPIVHGDIRLLEPRFNFYTLWNGQGIGLTGFAKARLCVELSAIALQEWLRITQPKLSNARIDMSDGHVKASGTLRGWQVALDVLPQLDVDRRVLSAALSELTIGPVSLPGWVLGRAHQQTVSLAPNDAVPGSIEINSLRTEAGNLQMGCTLVH